MTPLPPKLTTLPTTLPMEGAVRIELEEGIPIFRASTVVLTRIEELLLKQKEAPLDHAEEQELCEYCHALERWQHVQFTVDHVIPFIWSSDGLMIVGLTATDY